MPNLAPGFIFIISGCLGYTLLTSNELRSRIMFVVLTFRQLQVREG
jgi:hypothetical protein